MVLFSFFFLVQQQIAIKNEPKKSQKTQQTRKFPLCQANSTVAYTLRWHLKGYIGSIYFAAGINLAQQVYIKGLNDESVSVTAYPTASTS